MRSYDQIISLGSSCGCSMVLRELGLQRESMPFDWIGALGLPAVVKTAEENFAGWFDREDLVLWDVRHEGGSIHRIYKNVRTGFGFPHEFSNGRPIESAYEEVRQKYVRRIHRFVSAMEDTSRRTLLVYLEAPYAPSLSDEELLQCRERFASKSGNDRLDLLYLFADARPEPLVRQVSDSVATAAMEYRLYQDGRLSHETNHDPIRQVLRDYASLTCSVSDSELRKRRRRARTEWNRRFGATYFGRLVNAKVFEWYCRLECYLQKEHLLPKDAPLWFNGDGK